jgi:hypothetical protein
MDAASSGADGQLVLSEPDAIFAARIAPSEPERPLPGPRRAIFFDVENTSRAQHITRVIEDLAVNRQGQRTEFIAVGNWRVIGHDTARLLARHGAHLVHSAPSLGVRDWSDLRIAVTAGVWLAGARPGDVLEIVSDDRAFDAVGDVAASLGIAYHRRSYRSLVQTALEEPPVERRQQDDSMMRRRRRGRGRGRRPLPPGPIVRPILGPVPVAVPEPMVAPTPVPAPEPEPGEAAETVEAEVATAAPANGAEPGVEPHSAPHDEIVSIVRDLVERSPSRGTSIDILANTLKARGFRRPAGSPRLITRLRRIKEIAVSRSGIITLVGEGGAPVEEEEPPQPVAASRPPARHHAPHHGGPRHGARTHAAPPREMPPPPRLAPSPMPEPPVRPASRVDIPYWSAIAAVTGPDEEAAEEGEGPAGEAGGDDQEPGADATAAPPGEPGTTPAGAQPAGFPPRRRWSRRGGRRRGRATGGPGPVA